MKNKVAEDTYLVGIGVSPGIGIGEVSLVDQRPLVDQSLIDIGEIEGELLRFQQALDLAKRQLQKIKQTVSDQPHLREHLYILDTHLLILDDEMLVSGTEKGILDRINAEGALTQVLEQLRALFDNIDDEYLRERRSDVDAVGERLLRILTGVGERTIGNIGRKSLVVAHELSPAETMQMDRSKVLGFITDKGGRTSHTAILARSLNIPAVVGMETITSMVFDRVPVVIDGTTGVVILNPSAKTFKEYLERKQSYEFLERDLENYRNLPPVTTDQVRVSLRGNLEIASDVEQVKKHAAEGIGLYR
ncbi:MAG: phosphoenolpyruvate--protein phosphotransferase, partial [Desulfuromonadales bacterium]|nr:phosphoenolpyruvate--protein phosphotransferase [Desulfuromonadales bacterium]